jgi:AraC-like DNA-binding protein
MVVEIKTFWLIAMCYVALQGLVLAVTIMFCRRGRRSANVLMSLIMTATFTANLPWLFTVTGWLERAPFVYYVSFLIGLSTGPIYYYYTRTLLQPDFKLRIPLVVILALLPGSVRIINWAQHNFGPADAAVALYGFMTIKVVYIAPSQHLFSIILVVYYVAWILCAFRCVWRVKSRLKRQVADDANGRLAWLNVLAVNLGVLVAHQIVVWTILLTQQPHTLDKELAFYLSQCLLLQIAGFTAVFLPSKLSTLLSDVALLRRRDPIDKVTSEQYIHQLCEYMRDEKPYRKEGLRLPELAEMLSIPAHVLSQLINDQLRVNYFDYINKHRVEEAKMLLGNSGSDQFTLVAIAHEAGFNSKASFNRAFRKHVGMSPSEFRRTCRERQFENHNLESKADTA